MRSKGFWSRLLANWPAKVLSLAAALLLFFFYRLNRLEERYLSVPLAVSLNDEFVPSSQYPRSVRITLRGESGSLFKVQEEDIRASLDLSVYRSEGVFRAPVQIEKRGTALGVDPLEIQVEPADVPVGIERKVTRVVPVTPSFRGFLVPGYELVSFDFVPPEVEVYGPASAMGRLTDVPTDFIELAGHDSDFSIKTRLVKKDNLVYISGPDTVEFRAVVQKSLAVRTFGPLDLEVTGLSPQLELAAPPPQGSITVRSTRTDVSSFEPAPGVLGLDLSAFSKPGTYTVPVETRVPEGFAVDRYEPRSVQIVLVPAKGAAP